MAYLNAVVLGENRKVIDQDVDAEFFQNFEGELDITSLLIDGVEFSSVLSSIPRIAEYVDRIEESLSNGINYPLAVYIACIKRYYTKDQDLDDVINQVDNLFEQEIEKEVFKDPLEIFANEKAQEFLESLNDSDLDKSTIQTIENFFDYAKYQNTLYVNDIDAVEYGNSFYFFRKN